MGVDALWVSSALAVAALVALFLLRTGAHRHAVAESAYR
jgi:hypothetical protein